jgi:hypothetical protein
MMAKRARRVKAEVWHVQVSLAQTGRWLWISGGSPRLDTVILRGRR